MSTELVRTNGDGGFANAPLDERWRYAQALAAAGSLLPRSLMEGGQASAGRIFLTAETGAMLGIHPIAAINGVNVIEGKPAISPGLMSALVRKAGHKLRVTTTGTGQDVSATAVIIRNDDPDFEFSATWDLTRARAAKLADKDVWKKYPEAMCKARAISEVVREGAEDALLGVHYVPEELGADVDEQGEIIAQPQQAAAAPVQQQQVAASQPQTVQVVEQPAAEPIAVQPKGNAISYMQRAERAENADAVLAIFYEARDKGHLGQTVEVNGADVQLRKFLGDLGTAMRNAEEAKQLSQPTEDTIDPEAAAGDGEPAAIWDPTIDGDVDLQTGVVAEAARRPIQRPEPEPHTTGGHY